jgi:hypothetical protein
MLKGKLLNGFKWYLARSLPNHMIVYAVVLILEDFEGSILHSMDHNFHFSGSQMG